MQNVVTMKDRIYGTEVLLCETETDKLMHDLDMQESEDDIIVIDFLFSI